MPLSSGCVKKHVARGFPRRRKAEYSVYERISGIKACCFSKALQDFQARILRKDDFFLKIRFPPNDEDR